MRALAILLALTLSVSATAAELRIVRVFTDWRDAASFKRISEYFDGKENTHGEVVLRTHPAQRGGYYFLVRLANAGAAREVQLRLLVVTPDSAAPREFIFPAALPGARETVFNLGLTGTDWSDRKINAVAWKLDVLGGDGAVLATEKSYLWEKPAGRN